MAVSKSQQKAVHKYVKANYDRMELTVPKGRKDEIKAHAEAQGQSVNGFINAAIDAQMGKPPTSPSEAPTMHDGAGVVSLSPDAHKAAQEGAESARETVPQFVERAIQEQVERDIEDRRAYEAAKDMLRDAIESGRVGEEQKKRLEDQLTMMEAEDADAARKRDKMALHMGLDPATGGKLEKEA